MDNALASLTPQQRETITDMERRYNCGHIPVKLTRVVRNEHGQTRVAYRMWHQGRYHEESTIIIYMGGETGYGGSVDAMGQVETLYEWPEEES